MKDFLAALGEAVLILIVWALSILACVFVTAWLRGDM